MLGIVSGAIYLFLSLNNAALLRWESFEGRNRRASLITAKCLLSLSLSLTLGVSIFDLVSPFLHLPLLSLSFLFPLSFFSFSSVWLLSRPSVPLLRFVFRVAAFHFDFPKLPARCQTFDYWIARVFLLRQFFLLFSSFVLSLSLFLYHFPSFA